MITVIAPMSVIAPILSLVNGSSYKRLLCRKLLARRRFDPWRSSLSLGVCRLRLKEKTLQLSALVPPWLINQNGKLSVTSCQLAIKHIMAYSFFLQLDNWHHVLVPYTKYQVLN